MDPIAEETVDVSLTDLNTIRAALNSAYHHNLVVDLAEQYRKLQQRPSQSKLTASLHNAMTLAMAYIQIWESPKEEESVESE